jgi:hypothetical protein
MGHEDDKYAGYKFPGQKEGEQIKALVRKHWVINVKIGLLFAFIGILPIAISIILAIYFWDGSFSDTFLLIALGLWVYLLGIMAFTYMSWLNEELDIIIVTNERVVSHDQIDLFHRQISETSISQIQDVKGVEEGVWGNIFHYGLLEIQTAAKDIVFTIKHASHPYQKARSILDIRERYIDKEKFEKPPNPNPPQDTSQSPSQVYSL